MDDLAPQAAATATALPARFYVDAAMADIDRNAILDRSWQLLAHVSQLRDTGDHIVADLGGLPVIGVRAGPSRSIRRGGYDGYRLPAAPRSTKSKVRS